MDALKRTIPCFRGFTLQLYTKVLIAILFTFMTPIRYFNGHSDCPPNQTKKQTFVACNGGPTRCETVLTHLCNGTEK